MTALACLVLAAALSAGNEEFERTAVRGAAEIAVARLRSEAVSSPSVTGVLETAMLADPARYATREAARKSGEAVYAKAVGEAYRTDVDALLARLAGTRAPEEVFGTDFVRAARALTDAETARLLAEPYADAFARERRAACEAQARGLVAAVRPPMSDVDSEDEGKIRRTLAANIAAQGGRTVFEENGVYISKRLVEPLLADAKREKDRQRKYVRSVRSDACAPSALERDIVRKLGENVRRRAEKTENAALRWEIFPSVTNGTLASSVRQRVTGRLADRVAGAKADVSDESVAKAIAEGGEASRTAAASRTALRASVGAKLLAEATRAAVAEAEAGERAELAAYLEAHAADASVAKALSARLDSDLDPVVARVRAEMATRAFGGIWPALADRTWYPAADLADGLAARSDYAAAVRAWRSLPALKAMDVRAPLEESERMADRAIRDAFELARAAVAGQTRAVDEVKPSVLRASVARKESFFRRTPDLKAIVRMLTEATEARWGERKNAVLWPDADLPKNAAEQHAELFPSVKKRIELVAKEILEEMEKPESEEPPETPPRETPPEEPKLEFSILVSRTGERVTVRLEQSGRDVVSRETDARLAPFRAAMKDVTDKLGEEILKLK